LLLERGLYPGVETPIIPDVVDALDDGDVVEGIGVGGLRRVRRVRWVCRVEAFNLGRHLTRAEYDRNLRESAFGEWRGTVA